jgi:tetrahydromethanopterin S-methyltransferase subunit C
MLVLAGIGCSFAFCVLAGAVSFNLIAGLVVGVSLWAWFWLRVREDIHFDRVLLKTPRFWSGKRTVSFLAGLGLD